MPATFTHSPAETERKEPGIGGKPPVDRRPTGGGGGGGDDDRQHERRGPRELLYKIRFSVFSILAADMMFFAILVALFFARQAGTHMDPRTHEQIGDWPRRIHGRISSAKSTFSRSGLALAILRLSALSPGWLQRWLSDQCSSPGSGWRGAS